MAEDFLGDRKRVLEEEFFRKQERALIERLGAERARQTARQALAEASGVTDEAVLTHLVDLGVQPDTLLALRLIPLVEVAWADRHLDEREKHAIVSALAASGIAPESPAYALVQGWLTSPPPPSMLSAWTAYVGGLCARLDPEERANLRSAVIGGARAVAQAAGGVLGLARISAAEEEMLQRLERAFSGSGRA